MEAMESAPPGPVSGGGVGQGGERSGSQQGEQRHSQPQGEGGARPETRTAGKLPILRWEGKAVHYFLL